MLATLSRWRSWVQIPSGALVFSERKGARYANWPSGQVQNLVIEGSNPSRAMIADNKTFPCVGWALASPGGRNPPAFELWRFNSVPTHSDRRPVRLAAGHLVLSQERRVRLPHGLLFDPDRVAELVDARASEARAIDGVGVRFSPRSLHLMIDESQAGRRPVGPHEADFPVRVRGLGLVGGPALGRVSYARRMGSTPMPATLCSCFRWPGRQTGKAARLRVWCLWVRIPSRATALLMT